MSDDERNGRGGYYILASLIALGASGRRGRRILRQLKRLCGWSFILCLLAIPMSLYGTHLYEATFGKRLATDTGQAILGFLALSFAGSLLSGALWCYLAIATWLTKEEKQASDEDDDDDV